MNARCSARCSARCRFAPGLICLLLLWLLSACSSASSEFPNAGSDDSRGDSAVDGDLNSSDGPESSGAVAAGGAVVGGLDTGDGEPAPLVLDVPSGEATIELLTAASGGGKHPLLQWSELADVSYYGVYLYAPSGKPYWFWRGEATSVYVGGAIQLDDNAMGVAVTAELTWGVVGYSDAGTVVGVSSRLPLAP